MAITIDPCCAHYDGEDKPAEEIVEEWILKEREEGGAKSFLKEFIKAFTKVIFTDNSSTNLKKILKNECNKFLNILKFLNNIFS